MKITVERAKKAYEVSGLKPKNGVFVSEFDGIQCGCVLSALVISECGWDYATIRQLGMQSTSPVDVIAQALGIDGDYANALAMGFDGFRESYGSSQEGYDIGVEIRMAVIGK